MVSARVRRAQIAYLVGRGRSQRRACALLSVARSTATYQSRLLERDAPVVAAMRALAAQYPRFGYRRIRIFLARQGLRMSADWAHRLWRLAGLQVPRRRPRRRVATGRPRPVPATGANHVWAYDFVFDTCANGQALKCLTVIDEYTRECLALDVAGGIRSRRAIEVLARLVATHGAPAHIRSDNGPEFVCTSNAYALRRPGLSAFAASSLRYERQLLACRRSSGVPSAFQRRSSPCGPPLVSASARRLAACRRSSPTAPSPSRSAFAPGLPYRRWPARGPLRPA
mgnify:CR=1 FL=1